MTHALTVYDTDIPKVRFGYNYDGGYVLSDLPSYDSLISFGVGESCSFEEDFAKKYNTPIYGFDHTIAPAMAANFNSVPNAKWIKMGVGTTSSGDILSISDIITMTGITGTNNMLQMDIEGAEWPLLEQFDVGLYQPFSQILVEAHYPSKERLPLLAKLNELYYIVHLHGNNACGLMDIDGVMVPHICEITYLRKDLATNVRLNTTPLPTPGLDFPNVTPASHPGCRTNNPEPDLNHAPFVNI